MATVVFYEKPGCASNTRQKMLLVASGHTVLARNLLNEKWSAQRLRTFFGELPVAAWFNANARRIKSGEVRPEALDEAGALALMVADPLLIRRPLLDVDGTRRAGFVPDVVHQWIGLARSSRPERLEACAREGEAQTCPVA